MELYSLQTSFSKGKIKVKLRKSEPGYWRSSWSPSRDLAPGAAMDPLQLEDEMSLTSSVMTSTEQSGPIVSFPNDDD